jgi:hypothetical protein
MDLYLPDEFHQLCEAANTRRDSADAHADAPWLGGEAFVSPRECATTSSRLCEPDPIWQVI